MKVQTHTETNIEGILFLVLVLNFCFYKIEEAEFNAKGAVNNR